MTYAVAKLGIDGQYIEKRKEPRKHRNEVDIKDFGEFALCNKAAGNLLQELANVFSIRDAKRLCVIALLQSIPNQVVKYVSKLIKSLGV